MCSFGAPVPKHRRRDPSEGPFGHVKLINPGPFEYDASGWWAFFFRQTLNSVFRSCCLFFACATDVFLPSFILKWYSATSFSARNFPSSCFCMRRLLFDITSWSSGTLLNRPAQLVNTQYTVFVYCLTSWTRNNVMVYQLLQHDPGANSASFCIVVHVKISTRQICHYIDDKSIEGIFWSRSCCWAVTLNLSVY